MKSDTVKKDCFKSKVEENIDLLYGMARRLAGNATDAEDLVGEAVTKAWGAFDSLADTNRFRPWIARILHNVFISGYRRQKSRPVEVSYYDEDCEDEGEEIFSILENMSDEFLMWWGNPEQDYINKLLGREITEAIDRLPDHYKRVIILINVEGFSYNEAAEILNIPTGTVRSRMKRGRTLLQKSLWDIAHEFGLEINDKTKVKVNE